MISPAIERVKPAIHLNGSGRKNLRENAKERYTAVKELHRIALETGPHQRDYYVLGDDAWRAAREQHESDLKLIQELVDRFCSDYYHITCAEDELGR